MTEQQIRQRLDAMLQREREHIRGLFPTLSEEDVEARARENLGRDWLVVGNTLRQTMGNIELLEGTRMCPHEGAKFKDVPGYVEGYGCPVCKGLSYHLPVANDVLHIES